MKQHLRSISMLVAFAVGALFHSELAPMVGLLPVGICIMLTITFLGIDVRKLRPTWMHLVLLAAIQVMGVGSWFIVQAAGYPILAESLYYCAAAPIASASPIIINLLRGNIEFSTTAMVLSQIAFAVITPFVLPIVVHDPSLSYMTLAGVVAWQILTVLGIPALVAVCMRLVYPRCRSWTPRLSDVSLGIWVFNLLVISAAGVERIVSMGYSLHDMWPMIIGAAIVCLIGFVAGYWLGYPRLKRECSQGLGQKNTVLTLYMASQSYATPLAYIGPVFYVFCHNTANAVQLALAAREKRRSASPTASK